MLVKDFYGTIFGEVEVPKLDRIEELFSETKFEITGHYGPFANRDKESHTFITFDYRHDDETGEYEAQNDTEISMVFYKQHKDMFLRYYENLLRVYDSTTNDNRRYIKDTQVFANKTNKFGNLHFRDNLITIYNDEYGEKNYYITLELDLNVLKAKYTFKDNITWDTEHNNRVLIPIVLKGNIASRFAYDNHKMMLSRLDKALEYLLNEIDHLVYGFDINTYDTTVKKLDSQQTEIKNENNNLLDALSEFLKPNTNFNFDNEIDINLDDLEKVLINEHINNFDEEDEYINRIDIMILRGNFKF